MVVSQRGMSVSSWTCHLAGCPRGRGFPGHPPAPDWLLFPQKREAFCQLLQLMKNKHSKQDEPDMISVFIGTWNMGQARAGAGVGERKGPMQGPDHLHPLPLQEVCRLQKM